MTPFRVIFVTRSSEHRRRLAASRQMLSELLAAVDVNDGHLPGKNRLFKAGFGVLVVALLGCLGVALTGYDSLDAFDSESPH